MGRDVDVDVARTRSHLHSNVQPQKLVGTSRWQMHLSQIETLKRRAEKRLWYSIHVGGCYFLDVRGPTL
jgi:hypothetical protein